MCADSRQRTSQIGQTETRADGLQARLSTPVDTWIHLREQWQALHSQAREVRAESRNYRHARSTRSLTKQMGADESSIISFSEALILEGGDAIVRARLEILRSRLLHWEGGETRRLAVETAARTTWPDQVHTEPRRAAAGADRA